MEALTTLQNRVSCSRLVAPAPSGEVLENIMKAALRAADHGCLRPWRFLIIEGEGLVQLGELLLDAASENDADIDDNRRQNLLRMPLRAPMIIVAIACTSEHPKVPVIEQLISCGAAAQNMISAAYAQGVGAMWRTGALAYDKAVHRRLGLSESEDIVGFVYLGTPEGKEKPLPKLQATDFFSNWPNSKG